MFFAVVRILAGIAGGVDPRRTVQGLNLQPRIVGQDGLTRQRRQWSLPS